jgi:hypothetical protein
MIDVEKGTLRYRQINTLSWRIATELCRRDSDLYITFPEGGSDEFADALMVTTLREARYQMRRVGGGVVSHGDKSVMVPWEKVLNRESPRAVAYLMEANYGLIPHKKAGPTTPRTLGYRILSAALDGTLSDRGTWTVGAGSSPEPLLSEASGQVKRSSDLTAWSPDQTRWTLLRAEEAVAEFDSHGYVKTDRGLFELMSLYKSMERRVGKVLYEVLGHRLP